MKKDKQTIEAINYFYTKSGVTRPDSPKKAAALAIKAAVERNPTYYKEITRTEVKEIHNIWSNLLMELFIKYSKEQGSEEFVKDIETLCDKMNNGSLKKLFNNSGKGLDNNYPKRFRVSHAQKSLSVFLKHMWCITEDMPMPPACPIDRRILQEAKIYEPWTKLDCIKTYKEWLNKIANLAGNEPLAKWELVKWNQPSRQRVTNKTESSKQGKSNRLCENILPAKNKNDELIKGEWVTLNGVPFRLFVANRKDKGYFCQLCYKHEEDREKSSVFDIKKVQDVQRMFNEFDNEKWHTGGKKTWAYVMYEGNDAEEKAKALYNKILLFVKGLSKQ